jgi:glycosyltransferase 2 family protein
MKNSKALDILKNIWVLVVLAGAVYFVYSYRIEFLEYIRNIDTIRLLAALFLIFIGRIFLNLTSFTSLRQFGSTISFSRLFSIISQTQLGKYLPGGIWHVVGQFGMYRANNLSNQTSGIAMILENIWIVGGAFCMGAITLGISGQVPAWLANTLLGQYRFLLPILAVLIAVAWAAMIWLSTFILAKVRTGYGTLIPKVVFFQCLAWLFFGSSFGVLFPNFSISWFLLAVSGFAIAWVGGYVFVLAPAGVGVREVLLSLFFTPFIPVTQIAVMVIVHRIIWTIAEIFLALISWGLDRIVEYKKKMEEQKLAS